MNEFMRLKILIEDWTDKPEGMVFHETDKKCKLFGTNYYRSAKTKKDAILDIDSTWIAMLDVFQDALIEYGFTYLDSYRFSDVLKNYESEQRKNRKQETIAEIEDDFIYDRELSADNTDDEPPEEIWKLEDNEPIVNTTDGYYKEAEE